jgi:hypothetical protein
VVDFMDNELNDFKSFVKTKVEPVKARILKIQKEITAFQNPILQELIQIRTQNESLLKELTRQKKVYREMLAEFYKMVAINESHAETLSLKELGWESRYDSPMMKKRSTANRHWRLVPDALENSALESPEASLEKNADELSIDKTDLIDIRFEAGRLSKSIPKSMRTRTKQMSRDKMNKLNSNLDLSGQFKNTTHPISMFLRRNLTRE